MAYARPIFPYDSGIEVGERVSVSVSEYEYLSECYCEKERDYDCHLSVFLCVDRNSTKTLLSPTISVLRWWSLPSLEVLVQPQELGPWYADCWIWRSQ